MHVKKFLSDSKEKNKLEILDNWSILKEKKKIVFKFSILSYHETKLFGIYFFNHVSCISIFIWKIQFSVLSFLFHFSLSLMRCHVGKHYFHFFQKNQSQLRTKIKIFI
jgi:hypothetical protein